MIPVLDQIATDKREFTRKFIQDDNKKLYEEPIQINGNDGEKKSTVSVLVWKDKGLTTSKWKWYAVSKDRIPQELLLNEKTHSMLCRKAIELSLMDEKSEMVALGNTVVNLSSNSSDSSCYIDTSNSPIALNNNETAIEIVIVPYFSTGRSSYRRYIVPPKSRYFTVSVKIQREDLPRVKSDKLEVKLVGE